MYLVSFGEIIVLPLYRLLWLADRVSSSSRLAVVSRDRVVLLDMVDYKSMGVSRWSRNMSSFKTCLKSDSSEGNGV